MPKTSSRLEIFIPQLQIALQKWDDTKQFLDAILVIKGTEWRYRWHLQDPKVFEDFNKQLERGSRAAGKALAIINQAVRNGSASVLVKTLVEHREHPFLGICRHFPERVKSLIERIDEFGDPNFNNPEYLANQKHPGEPRISFSMYDMLRAAMNQRSRSMRHVVVTNARFHRPPEYFDNPEDAENLANSKRDFIRSEVEDGDNRSDFKGPFDPLNDVQVMTIEEYIQGLTDLIGDSSGVDLIGQER